MDFDFSDEQKLLRDQIRRMLADKDARAGARATLESGADRDENVWRALVELGLPGAGAPEALGGAGLGELENCVVMEETGRALAATPLASTLAALAALAAADGPDAEDARKQWVPRLCAGEATMAVALAEGAGAFIPERLNANLTDGALSGDKLPVPDLMAADAIIVAVRGGGLALVEATAQGVSREAVETLDPARPQGRARFDGARALTLAVGPDALETAMTRMAVHAAFEALGVADAALEDARAYVMERYAFGRPIGSFQAVKHRLADMYIGAQLARSNCYRAAMALASNAADAGEAAAAAFVAASQAATFAGEENVQVHGGLGFTWDSDCQLFTRRARGVSLRLGGVSAWKERLVRVLERANAPAAGGTA